MQLEEDVEHLVKHCRKNAIERQNTHRKVENHNIDTNIELYDILPEVMPKKITLKALESTQNG